MTEAIRVLLVDDCPTVLAGLRKVLESPTDVTVLADANDGETALGLIESLQPDEVLLDCQMPGMSGTQVAATLQKMGTTTNVLAFSVHYDDETVRGMLNAGAIGYVLKDEPPERIIQAVRAVARGESWFSQGVAKQIATWVSVEQSNSPKFTERELDVLRLLAQGKSNQQIAAELCITERTLRHHLGNIYAILGVHSDREAMVWAIKHNLGNP
ncbi:MAG: response regulator transcription factor [Chloroflexi bacterium]|nr:response regulator transcription factor [Chloroflexota bacterium]